MKEDRLTHLVYEAALDNSLWPEMIIELAEHMETASKALPGTSMNTQQNHDILVHLSRAFSINNEMLQSKEATQMLAQVLDSISFGITLFGEAGDTLFENSSMKDIRQALSIDSIQDRNLALMNGRTGQMRHLIREANAHNTSIKVELEHSHDSTPMNGLLLSRSNAITLGFPQQATAVLLVTPASMEFAARQFSEDFDLTPRESELVVALTRDNSLKLAAQELRISYESCRSYLKRIFNKSGVSSQTELYRKIASHPTAIIRSPKPETTHDGNVRMLTQRDDGGRSNIFSWVPQTIILYSILMHYLAAHLT